MSKHNREKQLQYELERQGKFDEFTGDNINLDDVVEIDKDYEYIKHGFGYRMWYWFCSIFSLVLAPIINFFGFNLKIKGRKNIAKIKPTGAMCVSSHINYLDSLFVRQAVGFRCAMYATGALFNNKRNLVGKFLRGCGFLPLSENLSAQKKFGKAIHEAITEEKALIQFFAERAMWHHYPKPRPFKKGAFYYAVKENVPVLPIYVYPVPSKGLRKLFGFKTDLVLTILDPIQPNEELVNRERIADIQKNTQKAFIDEYRRVFNVTDECIYDIAPEAMDSLNEETRMAMKL